MYSTRPPATELASASFSLTTVEETIAASANQVDSVVISPNPPTLGGLVTVTVSGASGTIGADQTLVFTPAVYLSWNADAFELQSTSITLSGGNTGTSTDRLAITVPNSPDTGYTAVYTFRMMFMNTE